MLDCHRTEIAVSSGSFSRLFMPRILPSTALALYLHAQCCGQKASARMQELGRTFFQGFGHHVPLTLGH